MRISHRKPPNLTRIPRVARVCTAFFAASRRFSGFSFIFMASHSKGGDRAQSPASQRPRRVAAIAILLYYARMGFEDQRERLKRRLDAAPKRERAPRVGSLLRAMRDEIVAVAEEKNLSYKDIQQMLAADGLAVSISTLSRHLGAKRKGRERGNRTAVTNATSATDKPSLREAEQRSRPPEIAPTNAGKRAAGGEGRPIPPMPSPFPSTTGPTKPQGPPDATVPRASSFPIRRDRERI